VLGRERMGLGRLFVIKKVKETEGETGCVGLSHKPMCREGGSKGVRRERRGEERGRPFHKGRPVWGGDDDGVAAAQCSPAEQKEVGRGGGPCACVRVERCDGNEKRVVCERGGCGGATILRSQPVARLGKRGGREEGGGDKKGEASETGRRPPHTKLGENGRKA
jgi:hypothetical protein